MKSPYYEYARGDTLRLASRAVHRQAKKRWPDCPYPPKDFRPEAIGDYVRWYYREILDRYESDDTIELTRWELAANDRWQNAYDRASIALRVIKAEEKRRLLEKAEIDPYGHLTWGIGDENDFICLDWGIVDGQFVFQSVVNSETGCFIEEYGYEANVPPELAVRTAIGFVDWAYDWCFDNEVEIDHDGWNFSAFRFVEDVKASVGDTMTVTPFPSVSDIKE